MKKKIQTLITLTSKDVRSAYSAEELDKGVQTTANCFVIYGPYMALDAGSWEVTVKGEVKTPSNECIFDVTAEDGVITLHRTSLPNSNSVIASCRVNILAKLTHVEFRLYLAAESFFRLASIELIGDAPTRKMSVYDVDGFMFILDKSSLLDSCLIDTKQWDQPQITYLKSLIFKTHKGGRRSLFLDIGSYLGYYSLQMMKTHFFAEIKAFEVDPYNYRQLSGNLLLNDHDFLIQHFNAAVSSSSGTGRWISSLENATTNRGGCALLTVHQEHPTELKVPTYALDDMLPIRDAIIFAKIDVEGHEIEVLKGMTGLLGNNACTLQIECLSHDHFEKVENILNRLGYAYINKIDYDYYFSVAI